MDSLLSPGGGEKPLRCSVNKEKNRTEPGFSLVTEVHAVVGSRVPSGGSPLTLCEHLWDARGGDQLGAPRKQEPFFGARLLVLWSRVQAVASRSGAARGRVELRPGTLEKTDLFTYCVAFVHTPAVWCQARP